MFWSGETPRCGGGACCFLRRAGYVHAEDGEQGLDLADQPLAAVFVVLAGEGIDAAEVGAAHAAGIAVVVRGVGEADLGVSARLTWVERDLVME